MSDGGSETVRRARSAPTIVVITDPAYSLVRIERAIMAAAVALRPFAVAVQLRDKSASTTALEQSARFLRNVTSRVSARLVINAPCDDVLHMAKDVGADGAHVPCRRDVVQQARRLLGEHAWISTPAHSDADVELAEVSGATCVLVSPVFSTPGKGPARGVAAIESAVHHRKGTLLVHALGGIDASNVDECASAGADGVAAIRSILGAEDPAAVAVALDAPFQSDRMRFR